METQIRHDEKGNALICYRTGNFIDIYLQIKKERRHIGSIYVNERVFETKRKLSKHLHRKSHSYGFNHQLLDKAKLFDHVRLMEDRGNRIIIEYLIPRQIILDEGKYLFFLQQGFEKQIFLPLERIKQFTQ